MTEKRYTLKYPHWTHVICDTVENKEYYLKLKEKREEVVDELNHLHEENTILKRRLRSVQSELFCKDRILEDNGLSIECCDKNDK